MAVCPFGKARPFLEELEWRFIVNAPSQDIEYRVSRLGLTPFLETAKLTIEKVWIGPGVGPDPDVAKRTVAQFLDKHGIKGAKVDRWVSPFAWR
jgi:hypothetical protein